MPYISERDDQRTLELCSKMLEELMRKCASDVLVGDSDYIVGVPRVFCRLMSLREYDRLMSWFFLHSARQMQSRLLYLRMNASEAAAVFRHAAMETLGSINESRDPTDIFFALTIESFGRNDWYALGTGYVMQYGRNFSDVNSAMSAIETKPQAVMDRDPTSRFDD